MKTTAILILILTVCESLSAQISVGLSIGNNFSKIINNTHYGNYPNLIEPDEEEYSFTNGLFVGIPVEVSFTDRLSLFTTFSYLQKGTEFNSTISLTDLYTVQGSGTTKYNYLELPLQAKFYILKNKAKIYFMAGPSIGYLINVRNKYNSTIHNFQTGTITYENVDNKQKSKDLKNSGFNRLDISLAMGIGCDYKISVGKIYLNINYINGLTNMLKQGDGFAVGPKQNNRGFTATLGYLIPITK